jgi:N-acetylglucosaminyl-diphospho-decaprenol L-rhamnosyltransferase
MTSPRILTVILNWRTADMTLRATEAALREMDGIAGEITIVDNDSGDGSFEVMTRAVQDRKWHRVRVLQSGQNGGFGAGNNFGIRAGLRDGSQPDYIYILNSDAFPDPGSIRALLDHLERHPATGFAGSYIHGPDGDPHLTSFRFPTALGELEGAAKIGPISRLLHARAVPIPIPDRTQRVDWLAGASLMMRASVLDRIGLFDEAFFLYFEETDLCLRAARAGYPTDYVRESEVTHIGSHSTGMKEWEQVPDYWYHSRLYYFRKNHGWLGAVLATKAHVTGGLLHRLRALLTRRKPADPPRFLRRMIAHDTAALLRPKSTPKAAIPALTGA